MRYRPDSRRGTALTLAIVVSFVLTGLVITLAWLAGEQTQRTSGLKQTDQAFFAAEAGAQRLQWYCKTRQIQALTTQPLKGSLNGYNYSVTWNTLVGTTIMVRSVGSTGNVSYTLSEQMTPPFNAPAIYAGGTFDNKNIDIVGDVVANSYSNAGTGSLDGNLTYASTLGKTPNITGAITKDPTALKIIDFDILGANLWALAGSKYPADQTDVTFDFTALPGPNPIIHVTGNVVKPKFIGSGTLFATGSITVDGYGTPSQPVHLAAKGDISVSNNVVIYGSLYAGGNWHRGKFDLYGVAYVTKDVDPSDYAQSTVYAGAPPSFDPRLATLNPLTSIVNFAGPQP